MSPIVKLSALLVALATARAHDLSWEIAVSTKTRIHLLHLNGSLAGLVDHQFKRIKSIAYDEERDQLHVADVGDGSILYTVSLDKEIKVQPVINDVVKGIEDVDVDVVNRTLYLTSKSKVSQLDLDDQSELDLFNASDPRGIAIDPCGRQIFWTNFEPRQIERYSLETKERNVIVGTDVVLPVRITVDQSAKRIYWSDHGHGIYSYIESADFDGSNRQTYDLLHQMPHAVAVDDAFVYWTDFHGNALWRVNKNSNQAKPEAISYFEGVPVGLAIRKRALRNVSHCQSAAEALDQKMTTPEPLKIIRDVEERPSCLNGGNWTDESGCICPRGYGGEVCEVAKCSNYCLNGGVCVLVDDDAVRCSCPKHFSGERCDVISDMAVLYKMLCFNQSKGINGTTSFCEDMLKVLSLESHALVQNSIEAGTCVEMLKDPYFLVLITFSLVLLLLVVILICLACNLKKRNRAKMRYIVKKNVTPLTFRPQQNADHCEITIENCCNMNICETPCYEPPQKRTIRTVKHEEKKTLLANMEGAIY